MLDVQQLLIKRQEEFLSTRITISNIIANLFEGLSKVDPNLLKDINMPAGRTAEEILPALFTEPFDINEYNKQLAVYQRFASEIDNLAIRLNEEALKCLSE